MKGQYNKLESPQDEKELQLAIKKGTLIDKRAKVGRAIGCVKAAVKEDLNKTARTLLEEDVALAQTV